MTIAKTKAQRDRMLNVRLSRDEHNMLLELCDEYGVTFSGIVRMWIRKHYRRMGPPTPGVAPGASVDERRRLDDDPW